jgi:hypothetical protein
MAADVDPFPHANPPPARPRRWRSVLSWSGIVVLLLLIVTVVMVQSTLGARRKGPKTKRTYARGEVSFLAMLIHEHRKDYGELPARLEDLAYRPEDKDGRAFTKDPWGRPYEYSPCVRSARTAAGTPWTT